MSFGTEKHAPALILNVRRGTTIPFIRNSFFFPLGFFPGDGKRDKTKILLRRKTKKNHNKFESRSALSSRPNVGGFDVVKPIQIKKFALNFARLYFEYFRSETETLKASRRNGCAFLIIIIIISKRRSTISRCAPFSSFRKNEINILRVVRTVESVVKRRKDTIRQSRNNK